jgi:hypothetical protein
MRTSKDKPETDFLDYLRGLSFKERRAFDLAMGYVCSRVLTWAFQCRPISQVLLKASDAPLGPFHNEHRDRRGLFSPGNGLTKNGLCLDRCSEACLTKVGSNHLAATGCR